MCTYKYVFGSQLNMQEIEASLLLAFWSCESLHGEARVRLDGLHQLDEASRTLIVDGGTAVGQDLAKLFTGLLQREFPAMSFTVERLEPITAGSAAPTS